ncbi:ATP-dependent DNA helicase [Hydrogenophaga sp.]|uniref:ATP-dependent DNA helicase n=1 Tax=Hydrogenophaga sp. TaxID=1904254 RepID=UPI00262780DC|nr:ATP-dependent DNA helicase [Hydrogenophaga sp.]
MARAVAQAIESGGHLVVEAGTGVGKTFAYLVPILLSGRRALLSTATQALQDQLFARDVRAVVQALNLPVRVALLKGRGSYLCLHRLERSLTGAPSRGLRDPAVSAGLLQVTHWARTTRTGDLAELAGLDERSPLRPLISSTRDNCLGAACPRHGECHVNQARREALAADWVVVNHHLFFADQLVRESGVAALLPSAEVVVFDEAHQLNDIGIGFLGQQLSSGALRELARDVATQGGQWARGMRPWNHLALALEQASRALATVPRPPGQRSRWSEATPERLDAARWQMATRELERALTGVQEALRATAQASADMERLDARAQVLMETWRGLVAPEGGESGGVRWVEWSPAGHGWRLLRSPADSSALFRTLLAPGAERPRSWVFSSATLGQDEALSWFTRGLGLDAVPSLRTLQVPSPFDHANQSALHVPDTLPDPADEAHTPALAEAVARWASRLGGRTLVLTTTLRAADRFASHLMSLVGDGRCGPLQVLAQGRGSRRALLERFREGGSPCVLVASSSFWEGVDLPGDTLQLLVIDKLPFPPPDDPLMEARSRQLEARGLNAFNDGFLPEAAMALKQGAGRLIRSETDRGVLVIGDRRLLSRSYGVRLLSALPPMRRLLDEAEMTGMLDALAATRLSTTANRPT